jgi:starch phosphorylase
MNSTLTNPTPPSPKKTALEVNPALPAPLERLAELASNLRFSWSRRTRALFSSMDPRLWREVGGNPRLFLRCVDQARLEQAAADPAYLENYRKVLSGFDAYMSGNSDGHAHDPALVAYFCAEYGFHESFQIYSGGLGVLAGDHCKTASDLGLNFVAVGLLYTQGYFTQTVDKEGNQVAHYRDHERADLPVEPARDARGGEVRIVCRIAGRDVHAYVWRASVGRVSVYLLDTNLPENTPADREITHKLYGGDSAVRIQQEIVLGIGGVKALRALGLDPGVWHINEGHAAFLTLELTRELMSAHANMEFAAAREAVAAHCVFTTHTPVAAGHDVFPRDLVLEQLGEIIDALRVDREDFLALGHPPHAGPDHGFNMTRLALGGSRYHNGVSRIHGEVSSHLLADHWPQVPPHENPIGYVTNGVHVPTFLFQPWVDFFEMSLGSAWQARLSDARFWEKLYEVPDQLFWNVRQSIKAEVLKGLRKRLYVQCERNRLSDAHFDRMARWLDPAAPDVLTIGFARRFATYKRATLLFHDLQRLARLLGDPDRPLVFVFAGKSHPADEPGRQLLREVNALSASADFLGRVVFIEDYDIALARLLVAGVDVWLNNPISPLEASGTSGIKAAINGTLNLSVLDGWWAEGFDGENGWAVATTPVGPGANEAERDRDDANTLYELLEDRIIPLYYTRNEQGFSPGWVAKTRRSMATILPRFNTRRVLDDYLNGLYRPAAASGRALAADSHAGAHALAQWKQRVRQAWDGVRLQGMDDLPPRLAFGEGVKLRVSAALNGLQPQDVSMELILKRELPASSGESPPYSSFREADTMPADAAAPAHFQFTGETDAAGAHVFAIDCAPPWCGRLSCQVRIVPAHPLLTHPYEMGMMKWL